MINEFADKIKNLRSDCCLTQGDIVHDLKKYDIYVTGSYISRIERYNNVPNRKFIIALSNIYKIDSKILLNLAINHKMQSYNDNIKNIYMEEE